MVLLKPYYFYKPDSYWPRNGPFPTNYTILQMIRARAVKKVRVHTVLLVIPRHGVNSMVMNRRPKNLVGYKTAC